MNKLKACPYRTPSNGFDNYFRLIQANTCARTGKHIVPSKDCFCCPQTMTFRPMNKSDQYDVIVFNELYRKYIEELNNYSSEALEPDTSFIVNPKSETIVFFLENGVQLGFLVMGYGKNCHPDANWYIEEFYIKEEFRRRNIATTAIEKFVDGHPGRYSLFILTKNIPALKFWQTIIDEYKDLSSLITCEDIDQSKIIHKAFTSSI